MIILKEHMEAYSSFFWFLRGLSQEKKSLSKILGKNGPEKSQKKQVSSVGKKAGDVDCAE